MTADDPVQRIVSILQRVTPLDAHAVHAVDRAIRAELGGCRIPAHAPPAVTLEQVDQRLMQRMPVRQIATELGVHRSTLYRLLNARSRKSRERGAAQQHRG